MCIKRIFLLGLLLSLYLVPMILVQGTAYVPSDQSITSFSETTPDNTLFYPDEFITTEQTADRANNSGYSVLDEKDSVSWSLVDIILYFDYEAYASNTIVGFSYYAFSDIPAGKLNAWNYNASTWDTITALSADWNNATIYASDYYDNGTLCILLNGTLSVDYVAIDFRVMTLADSEHYAESFADVSDWNTASWTFDAPSSDGDLLTLDVTYDAGSVWSYFANSIPSCTGSDLYFEIRFKMNSTSNVNWYFQFCDTDNFGSGNYENAGARAETGTTPNTWKTYKYHISLTTVEAFRFSIRSYAGCSIQFDSDYLQIANSDEMGWQHDCSTTEGVNGTGIVQELDGLLYLTALNTYDAFDFSIDTTATRASLPTAYYPFLSVDIDFVFDAFYKIDVYDSAGAVYTVQSFTSSTGMRYYNLASYMDDVSKIRINVTQYSYSPHEILVNFLKLYSIANYTYSGYSDVGDIDHGCYCYVSSGTLYSVIDDAIYDNTIDLNHDPALSVDTSVYDHWATVASGDVSTDFNVGGWVGYSSLSSGTFSAGTLTDTRIRFEGSGSIASVSFYQVVASWELVNEITVIFYTELNTLLLDWFLIMLGLILIPASTIYIAYCLRHDATMNNVFYFILVFMLGWGLLIGGIY